MGAESTRLSPRKPHTELAVLTGMLRSEHLGEIFRKCAKEVGGFKGIIFYVKDITHNSEIPTVFSFFHLPVVDGLRFVELAMEHCQKARVPHNHVFLDQAPDEAR